MTTDGGDEADAIQFLMSGTAEGVAAAVHRMQATTWTFLSEPVELMEGVWSMWVVRPAAV